MPKRVATQDTKERLSSTATTACLDRRQAGGAESQAGPMERSQQSNSQSTTQDKQQRWIVASRGSHSMALADRRMERKGKRKGGKEVLTMRRCPAHSRKYHPLV
ncbi:hypothetical protein V8C37DRAFT_384961 [Trichoderma ceciliae]